MFESSNLQMSQKSKHFYDLSTLTLLIFFYAWGFEGSEE